MGETGFRMARQVSPGHCRGKKKWGVTARTEAQWRHLFEAFEISGMIDIHNWPKYRVLP